MGFTGYNQQYLEEYEQRATTPLGRQINAARWELVQRYCSRGALLDYGCATGVFHTAAPSAFHATGWDVNPASPFHNHLPDGHYDILTLWDVIEHLQAPLSPVLDYAPEYVFVCSPNADNTTVEWFDKWKHYKPTEHIHYYTPKTLAMSMASIGYKLLETNFDEGRLRDPDNPCAIFTGVYRWKQSIPTK